MAAIEDQLVVDEDENHGREPVETDLIQYLKDKLVDFHAKVSSYGTNVAAARGIQKLSSQFEILVFGPARVGKSTLIKQVSGDENIITSAAMNTCTSKAEKHVDKYNIHWWDTPGFENWSVQQAQDFFKVSFYDRQILPKVAIFCRTANALGSTDVIQYMFNEIRNNGILLLFVITKWPFIPKSEKKDIVREAINLLGGKPTPIYGSTSRGWKAIECEPKKSYIIPVNSKEDEVLGIRIGIRNINTLRKILVTKLDEESQGKLIQLYKDNLDFWTKLGYGAIEILDDIGLPTAQTMLTKEESQIYKEVKTEGNLVRVAAPIMKMIIDKYFATN